MGYTIYPATSEEVRVAGTREPPSEDMDIIEPGGRYVLVAGVGTWGAGLLLWIA
jgi:hypothetical protein